MADLIYRQKAIEQAEKKSQVEGAYGYMDTKSIVDMLEDLPIVDAVEVIRCKDCKHQEKFFHTDRRRKDGGYYIYGCELAEEYSHVCLDDDFCSRAERRRP